MLVGLDEDNLHLPERCAEDAVPAQVDSSHVALLDHQLACGMKIPATTAETMGISPALPCKSVLEPKQAHRPEGGPTTPANAEKVEHLVACLLTS